MSIRWLAFSIGLFSLIMGLFAYDPEVATARTPIITGAIVMVLALFNWIPALKTCVSCGRRFTGRSGKCPHCGAAQDETNNQEDE
ncbi:MAG: hypothetical protein L3J03_09440 [Desulfobacterales bacterium]|nr:hypothetical protein [Desulfobacterales bacterium]